MKTVLPGQVRKAIQEYNMIQDGDRIAIGVSGGKDSLAMLHVLANQRKYLPYKYQVKAFTVDLGFKDFKTEPIRELCEKIDVEYEVIKTDIAEIVFDIRNESNPCSLCAKMRKGAFNEKVKEQGFNKIALGHNKDDIIETYLMSMFYEGRLNTFSPTTYLSDTDLHVIRPLGYTMEKDVRYYVNKFELVVTKNPCPVDGYTKRQETRDLIKKYSKHNPYFRSNLFGVIRRNHISNW